MAKFWGLTVNVGKKFKQQVQESFCISEAALEPVDLVNGRFDEKPVMLYLQHDQNDFLLCTLSPKQAVLQVALNARIGSGETVGFHLKGGSPRSRVHLTGYTLPSGESSTAPGSQLSLKGQQKSILVTEPKSADKLKKRVSIVENEPYGEQEELESDDENDVLGNGATKKLFNGNANDDDDSDEDDDDLDEDDDDDDDLDMNELEMKELQEMLQKGKYNPKTGGKMGEDEDSDDLELLDEEEDDDEDDDDDDDDEDEDDSEDDNKSSPKKHEQKSPESKSPQKKKQAGSASNTPTGKDKKVDSNSSAKNTPTKTPENKNLNNLNVKTPSSAGHTPMKSFSKGGVLVNDIKLGNGQKAKLGKMVTVYYEGRLKSNNKRFDAAQSGAGFKFRLGKGEVIRGWDLGVDGMKIGGKRRLIIPAQFA